jgi:hypothetical protein
MASKPDTCPNCGSNRVASILYGLPVFNEELERKLDAEEIVLGGCCVCGDDPNWHCIACRHQWGSVDSGSEDDWTNSG